ncbi:helix-turn-helix transcriptional regulator [Acinetobacter baumannii]|uniref:helix-turn-helix transcriptional regulator n=1 Tax=Acinetobacter baumannii TaxID=470 RepID=UPI0026F834D3|nr:AraC family transcriptional regulator [Acinetobacter baumannii]MDO7497781.1 AraC family transcriptional regulator [Acinetobacter baumannii]MDV7408805.1 AraC family transcriptional regulator [Acinetobacter baumannii]
MKNLISLAKKSLVVHSNLNLPFAVYSAYQEQKITNVPISKPLLIIVLSGFKELGKTENIKCVAGSFIFLANSSSIDMRNIPDQEEYFALLIEFDFEDFNDLPQNAGTSQNYVQGQLNPLLESALHQFIDFSLVAPPSAFKFRKRELLELIYYSGYTAIAKLNMNKSLSERVQTLISYHLSTELTAEFIAAQLFMSSSTLRRKLKSEGNSIQDIRNRVRLGHGLHLIQTTNNSIGDIAFECGYQSQSRFTEQFKNLFGITPRELRKTKMLT